MWLSRIALATAQIQGTGLTDAAKVIADLGVTAVICAVVVTLLIKILNTMVNQVDATQKSILPEIQKLEGQIAYVKDSVMEAITKHNTSSINRLYSSSNDIEKIKEDTAKMLAQISEMSAYIQRLDTNIDSEQLMLTQLSNELTTLARNSDMLRMKLAKYQEESKG